MGLKDVIIWTAFVLYSADGRVLVTESGQMLETTSWLPYSASLASYPQCCGGNENCKMVRISQEVLQSLIDSPAKLRLGFSGVQAAENLQVSLAYNAQLNAASGHASIGGRLYYVAPLSLEERAASPCSVLGQENYMHLFHKLILLGDGSDLAPSLITPLKGRVSSRCCQDSEECSKIALEDSLLSQRKSILTIPLPWRFPQFFPDRLEDFKLERSFPPAQCNGFCDLYEFVGSPGLSAKVTRGGAEAKPELSISGQGGEYVARFCREENGYVINTKPKKDDSLAALLANENPGDAGIKQSRNFEDDLISPEGRTLVAGCTYLDFFCDINLYQNESIPLNATADSPMATYMDECRAQCNTTDSCTDFTVMKVWNEVTCYLLTDCAKTYVHQCLETGNCQSGPMDCNATTQVVSGCQRPTLFSAEYIQWQCVDIEGRVIDMSDSDTDLDVGTVCLLRCNSWETVGGGRGYLYSECDEEGNWTTTTSLDNNALLWPPPPYDLPTDAENSITTLKCNCPQTPLEWPLLNQTYNPNDETGAAFVCEGKPIQTSGTITLDTDDQCYFFCDDYLVTEVRCTDGIWSDSIDIGLWCYNKPAFVPAPPPSGY